MSELLPTSVALDLRDRLRHYLATTFSLAEADTQAVLDDFLSDPDHGLFKGPYVRLRLPYRPAEEGWRDHLEWYEGFIPPYGHQAAAFTRLSSLELTAERPRPQPTLLTTGTGSGKTEAFLYPILDHVRRAKRDGVTGTKALILYPMNALANDQADRLADIITSHGDLEGVTAALYTGQNQSEKRTIVTAKGLINDRYAIRRTAPDILLTNYKMLDQLLLREADARLWQASAHSLQYIVLDEFHTYDGAQGTDVAMLMRRLGLTVKSHWSADDPRLTDEDWARPLGKVTPVATSATMGGNDDPTAMREFAQTVFGEEFENEAVITESRLSHAEWAGTAADRVAARGWSPADVDPDLIAAVVTACEHQDLPSPQRLTEIVLTHLFEGVTEADLDDRNEVELDLVRAHPLVRALVAEAAEAVDVTSLPDRLGLPRPVTATPSSPDRRPAFLVHVLDTLSHIRTTHGLAALSVDVHLWVRELTRINRAAAGTTHLTWGDDGILVGADDGTSSDGTNEPVFPSIYCRHCGRSGWGVCLAPTGTELDRDDSDIRARHLRRDDRFRPLIHAPIEAERAELTPSEGTALMWLRVRERRLVKPRPTDEEVDTGAAIPILTHHGDDAGKASNDDECPSCQQKDGIRFLGSAIATLLSVTLSGLFGAPALDPTEKKALVFTDSVQDAAHRAGFIQARSHALTLRSVVRQALDTTPVSLTELTERVLARAGDDAHHRYRVLPPELAERDAFRRFWEAPTSASVPAKVRERARKRLLLDIELEFGLRSAVGRTLELTGSAVAQVDVAEALLLQSGRVALRDVDHQDLLDGLSDDERPVVAWVRGVLERMRTRGAVDHVWFSKFRSQDGNRWWVTGGRRRGDGMPGFGRGLGAPAYPRLGGTPRTDSDLEPVAAATGWYTHWTAAVLGVDRHEAAHLSRVLFQHLERLGIIGMEHTGSGGRTFHLSPESVVVSAAELADLTSSRLLLRCDTCRSPMPVTATVRSQLDGAPCFVVRCGGRLEPHPAEDNFYRQMYTKSDVRRVVAREHTSLLPDEVRERYETQFKAEVPGPTAPNVLVATPTLEMGIDIGDLSTVMLGSLPRTVASYLQRVGRAGRRTGNALATAFVAGRGDQLPRFSEPLRTINGEVRPPATYLDAEEILRRQFIASVADALARRPDVDGPRRVSDVLGSTAADSYLGTLIEEAETQTDAYLGRFLSTFDILSEPVRTRLREWVSRQDNMLGSSGLAVRCHEAAQEWQERVETLTHRRKDIQDTLPELQQRADSPAATEDDKRAFRTSQAALHLTNRQLADLRSEHWIGVLEEYGLLPNYTLVDDTVHLDVAVSWIDPEDGSFKREALALNRASALALRDLSPGATFYARGYAMLIDAIDMGHDGQDVRTWACCPDCGYVHDVDQRGTTVTLPACPRCGSAAIADVRQRVDVVELSRVSSEIERDEATIDDRREERINERFTILTLADINADHLARAWYVEDYGFGAKYLRDLTVRWLNLGRSAARGTTHVVSGSAVDAALFRVCRSCGKLDTSTGSNTAREHRAWCPLRKAAHEETRSLALSRTLRTEGLLLRLPTSVTLGDDFALPSLAASVLLALRERIGGSPDHIAVTPIVDPVLSDGSDNLEALLLHDIVPGGTGYLAELADPQAVWGMLRKAWEVLRDCPCQDEGRLACDRCLLPFAASHQVRWTARAAAERHLRDILRSGQPSDVGEFGQDVSVPEGMWWSVTLQEPPAADPESHLEQKFRQVLRARLETLGATIIEQPTSSGSTWSITMGGLLWRLESQVYVQGSKPDFVLTSNRAGVPPMAIFTDGWRYHASPGINRVADDAAKRQTLRDAGYQVLALTWPEVDGAEAGTPHSFVPPPWLHDGATEMVLQQAKDGLSRAVLDLVQRAPLDNLLAWMQSPEVGPREAFARWLPLLVLPGTTKAGTTPANVPLTRVALDALDGRIPADDTPGDTWLWRYDSLAVALRLVDELTFTFEVAVVLDDDDNALGDHARDTWREWLRLSNLLNLRTAGTVITTRRLLATGGLTAAPTPAVAAAPADEETSALEGCWLAAYKEAMEGEERALLSAVGRDGGDGMPVPDVGEEISGIPLSFTWPTLKIAVAIEDLTEEDRARLSDQGWTLVPPRPDDVIAAVSSGETNR